MAESTANAWCDLNPQWRYTGNFEKLTHHDGSIIQVEKLPENHGKKQINEEIKEEVKFTDYEKLIIPNKFAEDKSSVPNVESS